MGRVPIVAILGDSHKESDTEMFRGDRLCDRTVIEGGQITSSYGRSSVELISTLFLCTEMGIILVC
jgi:hypothetical protein